MKKRRGRRFDGLWSLLCLAALFLGLAGLGVAQCAAYDWDWRCAVTQCRLTKCSDTGAYDVNVGHD